MPHQEAFLKQLGSIIKLANWIPHPDTGKALAQLDYKGIELKPWESGESSKPLEASADAMVKNGIVDVKYLPNTREGWAEAVEAIVHGKTVPELESQLMTNILGDLTDEDIFYSSKSKPVSETVNGNPDQ